MPEQRRHLTGAQKLAILREHLIEKVPLSMAKSSGDIFPHLHRRLGIFEDSFVFVG
jgi:hypothetical protein